MKALKRWIFSLICICGCLLAAGAEASASSSVVPEEGLLSEAEEAQAVVSAVDDGLILQGINIGTVNVSGMTREEAKAAVDTYMTLQKSFTITLRMADGVEQMFTAGDLGLHWKNPEVVRQAENLGKKGNAVQRFKTRKALESGDITFPLIYGVDQTVIRQYLEERCAPICNQKPQEPLIEVKSGKVVITDGVEGRTLKVDDSAQRVEDYLCGGWNGGASVIDMALDVVTPSHSKKELSSITDVLGSSDTDYSASSDARKKNIETAVSLINGTIIYPGETFSTLETITPFTEENGYELAKSYANGGTTESFGGGICQVSTTLYLSVLRAELEVKERHNHSMIVGYVKPSMDAAIAESSGKDFRFTNNTDKPVYVYMAAWNGNLVCRIYGTEYRDATHSVDYKSVTLETEEAGVQFKTNSEIYLGVISIAQTAHMGRKAELYKIVRENGKEISNKRINTSSYAKADAIYEVGTKNATSAQIQAIKKAMATKDLNQVKATVRSMR